MIRTGTVLDMDMTTLAGAVRGLWDWWMAELSGMVPARWQRQSEVPGGPAAQFDGNGDLWFDGALLEPAIDQAKRHLLQVELPPGAVMVRTTGLPRLAKRDLARLVDLELDRLFPFPAGGAIADARPLASGEDAGTAKAPTLIGAMPLARAVKLVETARAAGIEPLGLIWRDPATGDAALDLLPALVRSGQIEPRRDGRAFWWGLVAFLFLANIGVMIWRDVAATRELQAQVEQQQAITSAARGVAGRIAQENAFRIALIAEHRQHDPSAMLALTTRFLPGSAWVQRFAWTADSLRLTGYKEAGADVQAALRRTGKFATMQSTVSDPTAEAGGSQPFDISAQIAATDSTGVTSGAETANTLP